MDPLGLDGPASPENGPWGDQDRLPPIVRVTPWGGWFPGVVPFDANSAALVSLTGGGAAVQVVNFVVPQNFNGSLFAWGGDVAVCDAWDEVTWTLRRNGSTILTLPPTGQLFGVMPDELSPLRQLLQAGDEMAIWALPGATTRTVRGRLVGYQWPALAAERA